MRAWHGYGAYSAAVVLALLWCLPERVSVRHPLDSQRLYAVQVDAQVATFDLPFEKPTEKYLVIVANLATDPAPATVRFRSQPTDSVELLPLRAVSVASRKLKPPHRASKPARPHNDAPRMRCFYLPISPQAADNPRAYQRVDGVLRAEGRHVRVYVDRNDCIASQTLDWIVNHFDPSVWPNTIRRLGRPRDVDGDGKFAILLTDWLNRFDAGRVSLGGLVRSSDFRPSIGYPFSNSVDVLYLNAGVRPGRHLETLLAHELAHAVTISGRLDSAWWFWPASDEESWLNEAIAHVAENMQSDNWSNLDYRVDRFLASPAEAPLVVDDYARYGLWRDAGVRGSCYLFLRWCVDRYGVGLMPRLIHSNRRGVANIESATGEPFERLFRRYSADLFLTSIHGARKSDSGPHAIPPLDLARPLGRWGLAGPRYLAWNVGSQQEEITFALRGTSVQYFVVAAPQPGPQRLAVYAASTADLQVSVVRLPDEMARLELHAVADPFGRWRLNIRERNGTAVRLTHLAWQTSSKDARASHHLVGGPRLSQLLGGTYVPAHGSLASQPISADYWPAGEVSVRVVGVDQHGYRVAAWTDFSPHRPAPTLAISPEARPHRAAEPSPPQTDAGAASGS